MKEDCCAVRAIASIHANPKNWYKENRDKLHCKKAAFPERVLKNRTAFVFHSLGLLYWCLRSGVFLSAGMKKNARQ